MRSFLKNSYEKIILVFLLVIFVALLVFQLVNLMPKEGLTVEQMADQLGRKVDYPPIDFTESRFDIYGIFMQNAIWKANFSRAVTHNLNEIVFTDFLTPDLLSFCPFCRKLISSKRFSVENEDGSITRYVDESMNMCNFCGRKLEPITNRGPEISELHQWMIDHGLDPNDPKAMDQMTVSGFTYQEHWDAKTNPKDPKSHPPFAVKLLMDSIESTRISLVVKSIYTQGDDTSRWNVNLEYKTPQGNRTATRTRIIKIGDTLEKVADADDGKGIFNFTLVEIRRDVRRELEKGIEVDKDYSVAVFKREDSNDLILAQLSRPVYHPRESVTFFDQRTETTFTKQPGEKFTLGDEKIGIEEYQLISADRTAGTALIMRLDDGNETKFTIGKKAGGVIRQPAAGRPQPPPAAVTPPAPVGQSEAASFQPPPPPPEEPPPTGN